MRSLHGRGAVLTLAVVVALLLTERPSLAGPVRDPIAARHAERMQQQSQHDEAERDGAASLPAGVQVVRDVPYGSDDRQRFDVYRTAQTQHAPVIFLVHGGGWRWGHKSLRRLVERKVARWVPMGFVIVSTDYRLLPTDPIEQAQDVARAIAVAQDKAASWGADPTKFVLMGHSAGAHLIMLVATSWSLSHGAGTAPCLGAVSLDSAALDVVEVMQGRHLRLYDKAFGSDPDHWRAASPFHALTAATRPVLTVCSTRRDDSCPQARRFATKAGSLGVTVTVLEKDLSHSEINARLGEDPRYTAEVESFMARLDPALARRLAPR